MTPGSAFWGASYRWFFFPKTPAEPRTGTDPAREAEPRRALCLPWFGPRGTSCSVGSSLMGLDVEWTPSSSSSERLPARAGAGGATAQADSSSWRVIGWRLAPPALAGSGRGDDACSVQGVVRGGSTWTLSGSPNCSVQVGVPGKILLAHISLVAPSGLT